MRQETTGFWDGSWHQLDHMQTVCTYRHPTPHRSIFTDRVLFPTPNQQCQGTEGMSDVMRRHVYKKVNVKCRFCVERLFTKAETMRVDWRRVENVLVSHYSSTALSV